MEEAYDKVPGVIATTSGYIGGQTKNPTYEQVTSGRTGHAEAVLVEYDPAKVTYEKLLEGFWRNIDPTQKDAQFCDHGSQYRSAIFYHDDGAAASRRGLARRSQRTSPSRARSSRRLPRRTCSIRPRTITRITT